MAKKEVKYTSLQDLNSLKQQLKEKEVKTVKRFTELGITFEILEPPFGFAIDIDSIPEGYVGEVMETLKSK